MCINIIAFIFGYHLIIQLLNLGCLKAVILKLFVVKATYFLRQNNYKIPDIESQDQDILIEQSL